MRNEFLQYLKQEHLISRGQRVILGVSGGIDSMVMAALFAETGIEHGYAHCNFNLRGKESRDDEAFLRQLAERRNIPFYVKHFNTESFAKKYNISIQMAARQLRFDWFNELLEKEPFDLIATAHHQDDQIETFFLNLMRSTGIAGLHGILPRQENLIHPLLFASRQDIEQYAAKYQIPYREDSSNQTTKYARNKIRHQVIPLLEEINPHFKKILNTNITRIRETEQVYKKAIRDTTREISTSKDGFPSVWIEKLMSTDSPTLYLFEYLAPFHFKYTTAEDIIKSIGKDPGKVFYSSTHRVIKDREVLIIQENQTVGAEQEIQITKEDIPGEIAKPIKISLKWKKVDSGFRINPDPNIAQVDAEKLDWPLKLNLWEQGDYFFPLGMTKAKKISDFLVDEKTPLHQKQKTYLLRSGNKVVWVAGMRLDNRFRIDSGTQHILEIKTEENIYGIDKKDQKSRT